MDNETEFDKHLHLLVRLVLLQIHVLNVPHEEEQSVDELSQKVKSTKAFFPPRFRDCEEIFGFGVTITRESGTAPEIGVGCNASQIFQNIS